MPKLYEFDIENCSISYRKFSNAEQDDLWSHLTKAGHTLGTLSSDMNVKEIMDSWTLQKGYPVVTVTRNGTSASLTQV